MNRSAAKAAAFVLAVATLAACHKTTQTTTNSATATTTTTVGGSDLPADCQTYFARIDALTTQASGAIVDQYRQEMAAARQQYDAMPNKAAAGPGCRAAMAALDQQAAILNQMGRR